MDNNENNMSNIYTPEEQAVLNKIQKNLLTMTDNIIANANPKDTRSYNSSVRVVNEVYTSLSKNINDAAQGRLKHQDSADREAILLTVAETLKAVSETKAKGNEVKLEVKDEIVDIETVKGELEIQPEKLELNDFIDE